jgi:hypothetical protein
MRIDDFDSQWHFVPDRPEALPGFRRSNRVMIVYCAIFVIGVFVSMMASRPVSNPATATKFGSTPVQHMKALAPQHATAPGAQSR